MAPARPPRSARPASRSRAAAGPRPARRQPDRYHHGDLRRALLLEALRIIQTDGPAGLTLRGVGDRLGVSRTALYRHFADKQALLAEVAAEGFRLLAGALRDAWGSGGRRGFDAMGRAYVAFAVAHPSHYRVMFGGAAAGSGAAPGAKTDESTDAFQVLVDAIVAEQAAGRMRREDPLLLALHIWATVHGVSMLTLDGQLPPHLSADALANVAIEWIHAGVNA